MLYMPTVSGVILLVKRHEGGDGLCAIVSVLLVREIGRAHV